MGSEAENELRRDWAAFCDADPVEPDFAYRMEGAGLIEPRKVRKSDVAADPFAAERGIEIGGWMWVLTPAGRLALAQAQRPAPTEAGGEAEGEP